MSDQNRPDTHRRVLMAFFADQEAARKALKHLLERDLPPDRVSLLGKADSSGDDPLGVYYTSPGERMKAWGGMGAFWGGLWGLLSGAAGMFLVPGVGPVLAAGPVVDALAGAAAGAGIGAGAMAAGGGLSQLTVAVHRMGLPEERLEETGRLLEEGQTLMMLIADKEESGHWQDLLRQKGPGTLWEFPYVGLHDVAREKLAP